MGTREWRLLELQLFVTTCVLSGRGCKTFGVGPVELCSHYECIVVVCLRPLLEPS